MFIENRYLDLYENYELNPGVYIYSLTDKDKQILDEAIWIVDNKTSIRQTAKNFNRSKSIVHVDLHKHLNKLSSELYCCVCKQLKNNKAKYFK